MRKLTVVVEGNEALAKQKALESGGFRIVSWTVLFGRQVKLTFVRTANTKVILKLV